TEVEVNGEKSVISSVGQFELSSKPYTFDRFFTSTGYAPNDVTMSGMTITSTMYLDNEYSQIGASQSGNAGINIEAEIICAGTLSLNNAPINSSGSNTFDITVGNNLIMTYEGGQGAMNLNGGRIRVGGNLIQGTSFNYKNDTDVYVLGDFISGRPSDDSNCGIFVDGDAAFYGNESYRGPVYVNGDVYLDKDVNAGQKFAGGLTVGGNIYINTSMPNYESVINTLKGMGIASSKIKTYTDDSLNIKVRMNNNGTMEETQYNALRAAMDRATQLAGGTSAYQYVWPSENFTCESIENVRAKINSNIGNPEYANWNMLKHFKNSDGTYKYDLVNLSFDGNTTPQSQDARFNGTGSNTNQAIISAEKFGKYVIMGDVRVVNNTWNGYNIVFDTTMPDGNDIDMYVYLPANCYMQKFEPQNDWSGPTYSFSNSSSDRYRFNCFRWNNEPSGVFEGWFSVLVKGKGSVVFVVAEGITYMAQERLFMGHYNLLKEILPNAISSTSGTVMDTASFTRSAVADIMNEKGIFKSNVVSKYDSTGGLHNNIFVVAIDKNSDVNFDPQYNTMCGYVYAPYMTFGAGKSTEGHFAMLGGLIVSDYTMPNTSRVFMSTLPYDYYDRFVSSSITDPDDREDARYDYMENLISASGGNLGTLGSSTSRTWRKFGYN
ncbi:MAG: hypothetical protein IKT78_03940, partial [Ruminiclostridium sp.]|nr:hypothetical protein [Ruminiclostridium sp.]